MYKSDNCLNFIKNLYDVLKFILKEILKFVKSLLVTTPICLPFSLKPVDI